MWPRVSAEIIAHLSASRRPLLAVLGPTASGKTDASIGIAEGIAATSAEHGWRGCEIVNVDSRQLYKRLDLGTAKIRPEEMRGIPHHLIDVLDPKEELTIARYKELAEAAIDDVLSRRAVPMLVGGSMLYASAVLDDLKPLPAGDPALRARLQAEYDADGGKAIHARLAAADPKSGRTFDVRNRASVVRAVEILEVTGKPPSEIKTTGESRYDALAYVLWWKNEELAARIDARTVLLLKGGWIREVWGLLVDGYGIEDPGMKSHGYREIASAILDVAAKEGVAIAGDPPPAVLSLQDDPELERVIAGKTRLYAKRQRTWWRDDEKMRKIEMPIR
jgi:tRNA dimethylallyltransferase